MFVSNVPQPEFVTLSGRIHIVTEVSHQGDPIVPIAVHTNLDGVSGIGQITGNRYEALGASQTNGVLTIPGSFSFRANFRLQPSDPCSPGDLCRSLPISLSINSQGVMTGAAVGGTTD